MFSNGLPLSNPAILTKTIQNENFIKSNSKWFIKLFRISASLGLLIYIIYAVELKSVLTVIGNAQMDMLLAVVALLLADRIFAAYRWYILLPENRNTTVYKALKLILVSGFAGLAFPGSAGVEMIRIYGVAKSPSGIGAAVSSVVAERVFAVAALLTLVIIGLFIIPTTAAVPNSVSYAATAAMIGLIFFCVAMTNNYFCNLFIKISGRTSSRLEAALKNTVESISRYRNNKLLIGKSVVLAFCFQLIRVITTAVAALAIGGSVDFVYFLAFVPIIIFVSLLPFSIGGLGIQEAGFVYLFGLAGMTPESALSLSILMRIGTLVFIIPGGLLYAKEGIKF